MFTWPKPEITDYEQKYVRMYREPMLDANGNAVKDSGGQPKFWPGVLRRMYKVSLNNVAIPNVQPYQDGPHFEQQYLATRRTRVFGLTFWGDVASWFLSIKSLSGETYTVNPCLVSSMVPGSGLDANAAVGENPQVSSTQVQEQLQTAYNLQLDPNWILDPNDGLIFTGLLAAKCDIGATPPSWPYRVLTIGIHVWEFPGMSRSTPDEVQGKV